MKKDWTKRSLRLQHLSSEYTGSVVTHNSDKQLTKDKINMEEKNETEESSYLIKEKLENLDVSEMYQKANVAHLAFVKELSRQIKSVTTKDKIKFWFTTKYCGYVKEIYFKIIDAIPGQVISDCEKAANEIVEAIFQNIFHSYSGFELTQKTPISYNGDRKARFKTTMKVDITDSVKESICKLDKEFDELKVKNLDALLPLQGEFLQQHLKDLPIPKEFCKEESNIFVKAFNIVSGYFIDKIEDNLRDKVAREFAISYPISIFMDKIDEIKDCVWRLRFLTSDNDEKYIYNIVINKEVKISDIKKICIVFIVKTDLF